MFLVAQFSDADLEDIESNFIQHDWPALRLLTDEIKNNK